MRLKLLQVGEPVLRQPARALSADEILSATVQELIGSMRETLKDAPGVGLAAPQVGLAIQLVIIEDLPEYSRDLPGEQLAARERSPVPFHVIINPQLTIVDAAQAEFFEGCLSLSGFTALVPRARRVRVECLNETGKHQVIEASGWYARILQHEIDHLNAILYVDRMYGPTFMSLDNYKRYWQDKPVPIVKDEVMPGKR